MGLGQMELKMNRKLRKREIAALTLVVLLAVPVSAHAQLGSGMVKFAIQELCKEMMGDLGALLTATAGFGAIVAAAFGAYRAFYSAIITAVGAFSISAILSLYFPTAAAECKEKDGNSGSKRSISSPLTREAGANEDFFNFDPDAAGTAAAMDPAAPPSTEVRVAEKGEKKNDPFQANPLDPIAEEF